MVLTEGQCRPQLRATFQFKCGKILITREMTSPFVLFWPSTTWRGAPTLGKEICFSKVYLFNVNLVWKTLSTDIPGIVIYQISGHPRPSWRDT